MKSFALAIALFAFTGSSFATGGGDSTATAKAGTEKKAMKSCCSKKAMKACGEKAGMKKSCSMDAAKSEKTI